MRSGYRNPHQVTEALKRALRVNALGIRGRQEFFFDRLLCRVFADTSTRAGDTWMLAGGTSLLARVPSARATRDIDLFNSSMNVTSAAEELKQLASTDLDDFVSFRLHSQQPIMQGNAQPYADGIQLRFDCFIGVTPHTTISVDLVTRLPVIGEPAIITPRNRLALDVELTTYPYRLYPVVDQIADKLCAMMGAFGTGSPSTREKDLVDVILLAVTQEIFATELRKAILAESARRRIPHIATISPPTRWAKFYEKTAATIPDLHSISTFESANALLRRFLLPVLSDEHFAGIWDCETQMWRIPETPTRE